MGIVVAEALAGAACAGLLDIHEPKDSVDASVLDATDSASADRADSTSRPEASDSPHLFEADAAFQDVASGVDSAFDGTSDAKDAGEDSDASNHPCGVCVSGSTEACGDGGMQTCTAQCKWGNCSVPNTVGCSDGTRDGFLGTTAFARIAGCLGDWNEGSMRAPKTGMRCGNSLATRCAVPADLCAPGWHVCGTPPYGPSDISAKITNAQCISEKTGAYAAALGDQECEPCSAAGFGAICCGTPCVQQNGSCVWADATAWVGVIAGHDNRCSDVYNSYPSTMGALCCMD
jgi:hypothetical protein